MVFELLAILAMDLLPTVNMKMLPLVAEAVAKKPCQGLCENCKSKKIAALEKTEQRAVVAAVGEERG